MTSKPCFELSGNVRFSEFSQDSAIYCTIAARSLSGLSACLMHDVSLQELSYMGDSPSEVLQIQSTSYLYYGVLALKCNAGLKNPLRCRLYGHICHREHPPQWSLYRSWKIDAAEAHTAVPTIISTTHHSLLAKRGMGGLSCKLRPPCTDSSRGPSRYAASAPPSKPPKCPLQVTHAFSALLLPCKLPHIPSSSLLNTPVLGSTGPQHDSGLEPDVQTAS